MSEAATAFWYNALHEPLGLWIKTTDPNKLKSLLYTARQRSGDPVLMSLAIRTSPMDPKGEIWIIKAAVE